MNWNSSGGGGVKNDPKKILIRYINSALKGWKRNIFNFNISDKTKILRAKKYSNQRNSLKDLKEMEIEYQKNINCGPSLIDERYQPISVLGEGTYG